MPIVDGECGRAFDFRDSGLDASEVAAAVAGDGSAPIEIRCPDPGPVHDRVGVVEPGRSYPIRAALASAARRLGYSASQAAALADVRDRLAALELPPLSLAEERRHVAETDDATALEEQVATLRGQLEAARERGDDPAALAEARERAVADLTERRTERLAAEQSLDRARISAREHRDRREERLRLEDRERNLQRAARRELAGELQSSFERALSALPGDASPRTVEGDDAPASVDGPDAISALAVCRIAPMSTPVVVAGEWFSTATAAAAALDAPVILVAE
ncbi:hypothetical protein GCM10028857_02360 [Salinarchaeum chitinilyticum]